MATVDFESLAKPVSADTPCGVDLELGGDVGYLNFLAGAEGMLPKSFFGRDQAGNEGQPFDRRSIDFEAQFGAAKPFLEQTRDLRLLGILAKFCILDRDLAGFVTCIRAISALLETHWEDVHPRGEGGDFGLRMVAIEGLDAIPTVVMPLQFLPLVEHERLGAFCYRNYMIAKGEIPPRGEDQPADLASVEKILNEAELSILVQRRGQLAALATALKQIRQTWLTNCPSGPAAALERLPINVTQILALFDAVIARRDPSAATAAAADGLGDSAGAASEPGVPVAIGTVTTSVHAAAALAAVANYFSSREPSNPALLLVRQAHALIGKSFLDVLRTLVPAQVERAAFNIGREQVFQLPIERLSSFAEEASAQASDPAINDAAFEIQSRAQALALLDRVAGHLRSSEPSSPIPYLIDRARDLAQRDFLSVLKALLPADGLKSVDGG
jgi:type VI secretion system protein ImpA